MKIKLFEDYNNIPYDEQKSEIEFCFDSIKEKWGIVERKSSNKWNKENNPFTGQYSLYSEDGGWSMRIEMPYLRKGKKEDFEKDLNRFRIRLSSSFSIYKGREVGKRKWSWNIYSPSGLNAHSVAVNIWEFYIQYNDNEKYFDNF